MNADSFEDMSNQAAGDRGAGLGNITAPGSAVCPVVPVARSPAHRADLTDKSNQQDFAALLSNMTASKESISQATALALQLGSSGGAALVVRMVLDAISQRRDPRQSLSFLYLLDSILRTEQRQLGANQNAVFPRAIGAAIRPVMQTLAPDESLKPKVEKVLTIWQKSKLIDESLLGGALVTLRAPPPPVQLTPAAQAKEGLEKKEDDTATLSNPTTVRVNGSLEFRMKAIFILENGDTIEMSAPESDDEWEYAPLQGPLESELLAQLGPCPPATRPHQGAGADPPPSPWRQGPLNQPPPPAAAAAAGNGRGTYTRQLDPPYKQPSMDFDDFDAGLLRGAVGGLAPFPAAAAGGGGVGVPKKGAVQAQAFDLLSHINSMQAEAESGAPLHMSSQWGVGTTTNITTIPPPPLPPEEEEAEGPPPLPPHSPLHDEYSMWEEGYGGMYGTGMGMEMGPQAWMYNNQGRYQPHEAGGGGGMMVPGRMGTYLQQQQQQLQQQQGSQYTWPFNNGM